MSEGLALKWPNDVLYANRKLAGILIESEMAADRLAVAIGIGVNCVRHPAQTSFPATDLGEAGKKVSPESLLYTLVALHDAASRSMEPRRGLCSDPHRLAQLRDRVLAAKSRCGSTAAN